MEIRPRCHCFFFLSKSKLGPMGPMGSSFKVFGMIRESTDVSRKLLCGLYKLVHPEKKKSPVWDHFHLVVTVKDNAFTGFVSCLNCKAVIRRNAQVPNKKKKLDFNEWEDYSEDSAENELNLYRHQSLSENVDENLLNWWKNHSSTFPNLARLAKKILSSPASSASS